MVACFVLGQRVPFNALEVVWNPRQYLYLAVVYLVFFVPFFFAASCIGLAFSFRREYINRIYFFDLLGAGISAVLIVAMLFLLLPQHALILLAALALLASAVMGAISTARKPMLAIQGLCLVALLISPTQDWLDLEISEYKSLNQLLEVVDTRVLNESSSPLGLLTVVESPGIPLRHAPGLSINTRFEPPEQLAVFTDGDGMSVITRLEGELDALGHLGDVTTALPYAVLDAPHVLILGAGTGADVLVALYNGAARVDAVELNPQMTNLVKDTYADFAGHIYEDPRVTVHTGEARGFVAKSTEQYDLIQVALLDSFSASGSGTQALNESYLYTAEAIREYLGHISPGGMLAITRWLKLTRNAAGNDQKLEHQHPARQAR
jgi:hypothetical protein